MPSSPWQAAQTSAAMVAPRSMSPPPISPRVAPVQATCDAGAVVGGAAAGGGSRNPGMPAARQIAAKGSKPASLLAGSSRKPRPRLTSTKPPTATLAQTRHGLSSASCSAGTAGRSGVISPSQGGAVNERRLAFEEAELRERVAVGDDHQEQDETVPKGEPVQGVRQPPRRMDGEGVAHAPIDGPGAAEEIREKPDEQKRARQHDGAAGGGDENPRAPIGDFGIGEVEVRDPPGLAEQAEAMPGQRGYHHADEPEPELKAHGPDRERLPPGQLGPDLVGDREIHDHHGAAEDQVEMRRDPGGVVDHGVHAVAHVDHAA